MKKFSNQQTANWMQGLEKRISSATVAVYDDLGRVLVVKANYKSYWSFPGGVVDAGETPTEAGVRELYEEAGLVVDGNNINFKIVVSRHSDIGRTYQFVFDTLVDSSEFNNIVIGEDEIEQYMLVTRADILHNQHMYSVAAKKWAEDYTGYIEHEFKHYNTEVS